MNTILDEFLESKFSTNQSTIARDLRLNLKKILNESALSPEEGALSLAALATAVENTALIEFAEKILEQYNFSKEEILEAKETAALLGMLNTYYKFKSMLGKPEEYKAANLRMTAFAKPQLGKERLEILSFAVSVINGCQSCIQAHEEALRKLGLSADKIHDLARLAAIVKGLNYIK